MTTTTTRPAKISAEDRKAQAEKLHASISDQVEELRNSDDWQRFLDFAQSFHSYSLNNLLLILSQMPEATAVAGFRQWQAKGRQVVRGARSIKIFGYSQKKITETDDNGDEIEKRTARFPILSVFDLSQTEPVEGFPDYSSPTRQLTGDDDHGIIDPLTAYLTGAGWTVTRERIAGGANGYAQPTTRTVVIDSRLSPAQAAKTTLHETAHVLLGHVDEDPSEYVEHRGLKETEAESVAYVVAGILGLDTSAYSVGYIAGWTDGDTALIKTTAERVLRVSHQIAEILAPVSDEPLASS